jgi:iron complex outermembrane receptor protein
MRTKVWRSALLAGVSCPMLAAAFSAAQAAPAADQQGTALQEIVVTAQKREESLQRVPVADTALTAQTLKGNRIQTLADLNAVAPNLTVRLGAGGNQSPNYTLRGILGASSAPGQDKGVSPYLDGVYLQNQSGSLFDLGEVERIEVLKGPQGTLFGRNATGGAISIITKDPTGVFGGHQDFTVGNYDAFRSKTHIEFPAIGPFSANLTYLHSQRRGDTRNLGGGTQWNYGPGTNGAYGVETSPKWLGGDNTNGVQVGLKLALDPFTAVYKFDYTHDTFTPNAEGVDLLPTGFLTDLYAASPNPMTPITDKRPGAVNNWFTTPGHMENWGHNLTMKYRVNDNLSFKNIASVRMTTTYANFQLDGLGGLVNAPSASLGGFPPGYLPLFPAQPGSPPNNPNLFNANPSAPFVFLANNGYDREWQWSDEFQLNYTSEWATVTAGYLHFFDHSVSEGYAGVYNTSITQVIAGQNTALNGTSFVLPANPNYKQAHVLTTSDAIYVQPELHLTRQLDFIVGGRVTLDKKNGAEYLPDQQVAAIVNPAGSPPFSSPIHYKHSQVTYLVGLNYRITDNIFSYVKFSTGYVSGGSLATLSYKPEKAASYEAGIKAELFDRRLRTDLAVFDAKYSSLQYDTSGLLTGVAATKYFSQAIVTQGDAKAVGFEWENTLVPVRGMTLTANVGYTNFQFIQSTISPGLASVAGTPGYQPFQRPKWSGDLAGQYDTLEVWRGGHLTARIDANFQSKTLMTSNIGNAATNLTTVDPAIVAAATSPFQWVVNARVALSGVDVGGGNHVEVALWGRNILNNRNITQFLGLGPVDSVIYQQAPTYGLDVSLSF